jgi:hypothetical protein
VGDISEIFYKLWVWSGHELTSGIVDTAWSFGPLTAMMVAPRTHRKQPTLPKKLSRSLRNMDERTAEMTTDRAPMGVTV